jgi:response regulator RpfG family c-di-GMP phosphodiesterase
MMPTMSGIELLNEIRKEHPFVRSIIISGKLDSSVSEESVLADIRADVEADVYLHKPVDNPRLKDEVAKLLLKKPETDLKSIAKIKLESSKRKSDVRRAEKTLNRKKRGRKK